MALFSRFRKQPGTSGNWPITPDYPEAWRVAYEETYLRVLHQSVAEMWRTQPYLRTVVNFMARNVAQLGLQAFLRVSDTDRQRITDGPLVAVLLRPNSNTTGYELIYGLVADLMLYDRCHWLLNDPENPIVRLPPTWVAPKGGDMLSPASYEVKVNDKGEVIKVPSDQMLTFHGWHPYSLQTGSSPVTALRSILAEQVQSAAFREAVWQRGGKVNSVLERPVDAPVWSPEARDRFKADWQSRYSGEGNEVGGVPILEDGMVLRRTDFSAKEMEYVEGARLALNTIASVYHINPTMVGDLTNANYANVREFRKALYGDTLGPILAQLEDRLNRFLVPLLDDRDGVYVEFNVSEKLQGNFEEQAAVISTSTGAPWLTRNEARARANLPAIAEGDDLVVPLNVTTGGLASPRDTAPPPRLEAATGKVLLKARASESHEQQAWAVLARFFQRQGNVVKSRLGGGISLPDAWEGERWDRELGVDLLALAGMVSAEVAAEVMDKLGFDPSTYDLDRTMPFLKTVSDRMAGSINATTYGQLGDAVKAEDPTSKVSGVFDTASGSRAAQIAVVTVTAFSGFAATEAGKQTGAATKTWIAGSNPRPSHAAMDGETVGLDESFSNGLAWPGDASGDVNETAGCNCELTINSA